MTRLILLLFLAASAVACGGRSTAGDAGADGAQLAICDEEVSNSEPHRRECGFVGPTWCGSCEAPAWCDDWNGLCREPEGDCGGCAEGEGCTLNGHCTAPPCPGPFCDEKVLIPEGDVLLGTADGRDGTRTENIPAFRIDRYEVTVARYRRCVELDQCGPPTFDDIGLGAPGAFWDAAFDLFPVDSVPVADAITFCSWEGGWLPSEAEWVKAARGGCDMHGTEACLVEEGDAARYPWGDEPAVCGRGNGGDRETGEYCAGRPEEVGSFPAGASPYGAEDMLGNVWEAVNSPCDVNSGANAPWCAKGLGWNERFDRFNVWGGAGRTSESAGDGFRCAYPLDSGGCPGGGC